MFRRRFLGRAAATLALATLTGCGAATDPLAPSSEGPARGGDRAPRTEHEGEASAPKPETDRASDSSSGRSESGSPLAPDHAAPKSRSAEGCDPPGSRPSAPPPRLRLEHVDHVLDAPITSLAVDPDRGIAAALGADTWMFDGKSWRPIPIPPELRPQAGERDEVRIHFGRDHQPRIMGNRIDAEGARQLYLRFRNGAWRTEVRELAAFGSKPRGALYGVLGWDDPEVVCKTGEFCLIKQRKGWSQVPLPASEASDVVRIDLAEGGAYALLVRRLLRLGESSWSPVGGEGPWKGAPAGAWVTRGEAWVSAPDEDALYHHDGSGWQRIPSPVREPKGLWGASQGVLWVAGRDGLGRLDATTAWHVADVDGPASEIVGRGERIWIGGSGGLWQATVSAPSARPPSGAKGASSR